jgi:hypothetical protein
MSRAGPAGHTNADLTGRFVGGDEDAVQDNIASTSEQLVGWESEEEP